ncbi:hypothetical protein HYH02_012232 [Chlamydomonas schloesseri]|uniref:Chlorophyll b reductase n=1 Tax=Chlamydomonas schloesseri TaxID=2026947 RepID=A0A835SZH1_9CHLO|nr:hypothetical protein HYH02_012232 [Chlamydomonas schloesseri]|eukprot:KAG2434566.1 hypothetical protein HYH02_012232 [Chlamydomonas schloesseri]
MMLTQRSGVAAKARTSTITASLASPVASARGGPASTSGAVSGMGHLAGGAPSATASRRGLASTGVDGRLSGARRGVTVTRASATQQKAAAASNGTPATAANGNGGGKAVAPTAPYNVVITGSTKGIGRALAEDFLKAGDRVVICSRTGDRVSETVAELAAKYGEDRVKGLAVDVAAPGQARLLADFAAEQLGRVDIWINNAGTNAYRYGPMAESSDEELAQIVSTNVLGVMLCCKEAIRVMRNQSTHGHIFNMDGAGADGNATPRFAAYGATKRSLAQLGKSLGAELGMLGIKNVAVHNLSPGMVTTELLMAGANTPTAKFFINCLAEPATDVAAYLVPRIRAVPATAASPLTGALQPVYIRFLTQGKALQQVAARLLTGARKSRYVEE